MVNRMKYAIERFELLKNTRLNNIADVCNELLKILKDCHTDSSLNNLNKLINFAKDIYDKIDWNTNCNNNNIEYMIILIEILNIFLTNNKNSNWNDFSTKEDFERIIKIIQAFRR